MKQDIVARLDHLYRKPKGSFGSGWFVNLVPPPLQEPFIFKVLGAEGLSHSPTVASLSFFELRDSDGPLYARVSGQEVPGRRHRRAVRERRGDGYGSAGGDQGGVGGLGVGWAWGWGLGWGGLVGGWLGWVGEAIGESAKPVF